MNDEPKKEILSLLESPELREYLMAPPEKLNCTQYAEIICGAPVSLYRKRELLLRLKAEVSEEERHDVEEMLYALDTARKPLESAELPGIRFIVELLGYNEKERSVDTLDGPFAVRSLAEAQQSIRAYHAEYDDNWTTQFWTMELYDWNAKPLSDGFPIAVRTYILSPEGEPQYFIQRPKMPGINPRCARAFGGNDLILPTPYKPGDILRIDCRPYTPLPFYCLLIQVRSGCCGLWCLFPNLNGSIGQGALLHGHYYATEYRFDFYRLISPLYRAELFTGELPENCSFMKLLSEKIHADPGYGDKVDEVLCDLKL